MQRMNKYNAIPVHTTSGMFDSKAEHNFYKVLTRLKTGLNIVRQFGVIIKPQTTYTRSVSLIVDFALLNSNQKLVALIEFKGYPTDNWRLKCCFLDYLQPDLYKKYLVVVPDVRTHKSVKKSVNPYNLFLAEDTQDLCQRIRLLSQQESL